MRELVEFIVAGITGKKAKVEETVEAESHLLTIYPDKTDMGLIIGKGGATIKAIRNLARVKATLEKKGVNVVVAEE